MMPAATRLARGFEVAAKLRSPSARGKGSAFCLREYVFSLGAMSCHPEAARTPRDLTSSLLITPFSRCVTTPCEVSHPLRWLGITASKLLGHITSHAKQILRQKATMRGTRHCNLQPPGFFRPALAAVLMSAAASALAGAETQADKSGFNLFNPTPRDLMRELSTDRPDKTESPYTVDAGHFQIESDLVNFSYDAYNGDPSDTRTESWSFANTNLKVGLLNNVDLQLVVSTFNHVRAEDRTARIVDESSGFGDIITRLKINVWGNDGGTTAFGVMPFVKFPTAQNNLGNDAVEGGLILPLAISLPAEWQMGLMTEFDFNRDSSGSGYHPEFINTITVSHSIVGELSGYVEFFSSVSTEDESEWIGTVDLGLTYGVSDDIQLDAGVNVGVTRAADDINPFVGLSWRF